MHVGFTEPYAMSCNMGSVWRTMGKMVINTSTDKCMAEILSCINVKDRNTIQQLSNDHKLADLELSGYQTLIIQSPGLSHISTIISCSHTALAVTDNIPVGACITTGVDPEYAYCYLKVYTKGKFAGNVIVFNDIYLVIDRAPEFVVDYEGILPNSKAKKLAPQVSCLCILCFTLLTNEVRSAS
jgi:hypothetical protein